MSEREPQENVTVSFILKGDLYNKFMERLPAYGERSNFLRIVIERFVNNELNIEITKKF